MYAEKMASSNNPIGYQTATEVCRKSGPVDAELHRNQEATERLHSAINQLEDMIRSVLSSAPPESNSNAICEAPSCDFHGRLMSCGTGIENAITRINQICSRVQL